MVKIETKQFQKGTTKKEEFEVHKNVLSQSTKRTTKKETEET